MTIDFYYIAPSPPARAVIMTAKDIGVEMNMKVVNLLAGEHLKPEFLKINPQHTVPVLVDGDLTIPESRAAMAYLVNKYSPNHSLYPSCPKVRAQIDRFLYFDANHIVPAQKEMHRPLIFADADAPTAEAIALYREKLALLDSFLDGRKYLVGENRTLADLSIYAMIGMKAIPDYDISDFKNVQAWFDRLRGELEYDDEVNVKPIEFLRNMFVEKKAARDAAK